MFIYNKKDRLFSSIAHDITKKPKKSLFNKHFHYDYEIFYIISGNVKYNIDGEQYNLKPHDLLLIPSSTYHFLIPESNEPYERYVINFDSRFFDEERLKKLFSPPYTINIKDDMRLRRMFSFFDYYYDTYSAEDFTLCAENMLTELLIYLTYKPKEIVSSSDMDYNLITQITTFIAKNIETEINSDTIAEHLNFSKSYIQNLFSKTMGIGVQTYINQKKIYAAHSDIQNGLSPYEAADKYCYNDYSSFFRQYKKIFKASPRDIKKKEKWT